MNEPVAAGPLRALVVEDDDLYSALLESALFAAGFDVGVAGSGEDALAAITARAPDLLLLDIRLPGISGLDVLRALAAAPPPSRIVAVAMSSAWEFAEREAITLGAAAFLRKPFAVKAALEVIRKALGGEVEWIDDGV
jgi:CheY-like chemotaxis protein